MLLSGRFCGRDRSVWIGVNEAFGVKHAAVIAIGEQDSEADLGYTAEVMEKSLQALGYRVVDSVKVCGLFGKGEALEYSEGLQKADNAGRKVAKTLNLGNK